MSDIKIEGIDELEAWLERAPEIVLPIARRAMTQTASVIIGRLRQYPAATEANAPGRIGRNGKPMGYYERNRGSWIPVMRHIEGVVNQDTGKQQFGKSRGVIKTTKRVLTSTGVAGYKLRATSEHLGKSWNYEITTVARTGVYADIGNDASYAQDVQGMQQLRHMAAIGWPRIDRIIEDSKSDIDAIWGEALTELAERFSGDGSASLNGGDNG